MPSEITARLQKWLNADDKLVQIQAPSLTEIKDFPTAQQIARMAEQWHKSDLPKLKTKIAESGRGAFVARPVNGKIVSEQYDKTLKITRWTLQNGDKVVVLRHPVAGGKTYLQAFGGNGFMSAGLNTWQAQLAQQIVWQSAPQGWTSAQLNDWKQCHKLNLSMSLRGDDYKLEGYAADKDAANLLRLYHAYMQTPQVGADYRDAIMPMIRRIPMAQNATRAAKEKALTEVRFGHKAYPSPTQTDLEQTEAPQLLAQWQTLSRAPVTYYLLTAQPAAKLKPLVAQYLAAIKRMPSEKAPPYLQSEGVKVVRRPVNTEARSDVSAWSFNAQPWSPQSAVQISVLRTLAHERLKAELRDKALGVYSLKFEAAHNPDANRIESELRFATTPDKADALWKLAELTLAGLPQTITERQVAPLRSHFVQQEQSRLKAPETWFNRLVLSEQHFGDARYLHDMATLADSLNPAQLRETAKLLWNPHNRRVLIADPMK